MKFGQFISYYKRKKIIEKPYKNCDLKTSSRPFSVCKKLSTTSIGTWNFWSKQNYQNMSKSAHWPPQISFYRRFPENLKGPGTNFQVTFFIEFFGKKSFYFSSYSVKCVSCFMIRHLMTSWHLNTWKVKIWLSQEWKELSKWSFLFFQVSQVLSFRHTKQTSKNVADTAFKATNNGIIDCITLLFNHSV